MASTAHAADGEKDSLDTDGDGKISAELAAAPESVQEKLQEFDKDGDGTLSKKEYAAYKKAAKHKDKDEEEEDKEEDK